MPFVEPSLVELLASKAGGGVDVVVPVVGGYYEPLCAVYGRAVTGAMEECLDSGRTKTTSFFASASLAEVDENEIRSVDPGLASFVNLNTPADYRRYCASS
jgi:molybdopterin-guanine dinucleotide biosynthesis protein A